MPKGIYKHNILKCIENLRKATSINSGRKHSKEHNKAISNGVKKSYQNNPELRKLRVDMLKKSHTPETWKKMVETRRRNKSYIVSNEAKEKQRKSMQVLYEKYPEKHPNRRMANRKSLFSQTRLFNWIKKRCPEAIMEYRIEGTRRFADIAIPSKKIDIEFDGKRWHNKEEDDKRDSEIRRVGWNVIRFDSSIFKLIG
jgi:very-short-patch-repair endonuclease